MPISNPTPSSTPAAAYLVYSALLSQTGTNAPIATVLQNTLGGTVVWTYNAVGEYFGTLTGAFVTGKTFVAINSARNISTGNIAAVHRVDVNTIRIQTGSAASLTLADAHLLNHSIEIRVYP